MDEDIIIQVENLSKRYTLGAASNDRYVALRDVIANSARNLFRRRPTTAPEREKGDFWALKDINFEVRRGEVVGIIGRNGAGKSTLLKVLSRITEPTTGAIKLRGRVASLLEVGTGFHPELTGRENIYLNGAILGMHRSEIKAKFDEIVAFAEVEKFLDTPVKRYSSGMYVRLAFAVAAHLEPEILIVDEVLAVGDANFQKKCLGKMQDVSSSGRTVFFVSHSMTAIMSLCSRAVYLKQGRLIGDGSVEKIVDNYIREDAKSQVLQRSLANVARKGANGSVIQIHFVQIVLSQQSLYYEDPLVVILSAKAAVDLEDVFFGIGIDNYAGSRLITVEGNQQPIKKLPRGGEATVKMTIPQPALPPGRYMLSVGANTASALSLDSVQEALTFEVYAKPDEMLIAERTNMGTRPKATWNLLNSTD